MESGVTKDYSHACGDLKDTANHILADTALRLCTKHAMPQGSVCIQMLPALPIHDGWHYCQLHSLKFSTQPSQLLDGMHDKPSWKVTPTDSAAIRDCCSVTFGQ